MKYSLAKKTFLKGGGGQRNLGIFHFSVSTGFRQNLFEDNYFCFTYVFGIAYGLTITQHCGPFKMRIKE